MVASTPDSAATEVGSIDSRNQAAVDHTPAPESVLDEKNTVHEQVGKRPDGNVGGDEEVKNNTETDEDDRVEYPVAWKLVLITVALCLSVFCVALVRFNTFTLSNQVLTNNLHFDQGIYSLYYSY